MFGPVVIDVIDRKHRATMFTATGAFAAVGLEYFLLKLTVTPFGAAEVYLTLFDIPALRAQMPQTVPFTAFVKRRSRLFFPATFADLSWRIFAFNTVAATVAELDFAPFPSAFPAR